MPLTSSVEFAASLQYAVRATDQTCRTKSIQLRDSIKRGRVSLFETYATHLAANLTAYPSLAPFFGPEVILVPAPGSALRSTGALWVPELICNALVAHGLGARVEPCLARTTAVPKSATSSPKERNTQRHYDTMAVTGGTMLPERILVVDDVVTTGATLLAATSRVAGAFPNSQVRAYALTRAISDGNIVGTNFPVRGVIRLRHDGKTWRDP